jgi:hypothetical protein
MRHLFIILAMMPTVGFAEGVLPEAIAAYQATCLATAPDFSGLHSKAIRAGMTKQGDAYLLPNFAARVELMEHEGGCACLTTVVAPDHDATAVALLQATADVHPDELLDHPSKEITAVLVWRGSTNALQIVSDTTGDLPMVYAYLLSKSGCPKR